MKEMKDAALANGMIEPSLDEIEAKYQCWLVMRCAAGLQLPPIMTGDTPSIISHALNVTGPSQINKNIWLLLSRYYQCCSQPFRLIKFPRVHNTWKLLTRCARPTWLSFSMDQVDMHAAMLKGKSIQTDIKADQAHTAALENKVHSVSVDIQNMKCIIQNMAEAVQAMQNMMMSNAFGNLVAPGSAIRERSKKQNQKRFSTESVDSNSSGHSLTSHKHKKLHKKLAKTISSSNLSSESDSESGSVIDVSGVASPKGSTCVRQYDWNPQFPNFTGQESWKRWYTWFDDVVSRRVRTMRNI